MQERRNPEPIPAIDSFPACRLANGQTAWLSLSQGFAKQRLSLEITKLALKGLNKVQESYYDLQDNWDKIVAQASLFLVSGLPV